MMLRLRSNLPLLVGTTLVLTLMGLAVFAPLVVSHDPSVVPRGGARLNPSATHWFGTDQLGRDLFARVLYGARTSLSVGLGAAAIAGVLGTAVGAVAGFRRGWLDALLMRVTDAFLVFPAVMLAAALALVMGRGLLTVIVVLGLVGTPTVIRVVRSAVVEVSQEEWVEASRAIGCSEPRVLIRHVLPHVVGPAVVIVTVYVGMAILGEATLSFLAIGVTDGTPSWGSMIYGGRTTLASAPHIVLAPAGALLITVVAVLALADGLRRALGVQR